MHFSSGDIELNVTTQEELAEAFNRYEEFGKTILLRGSDNIWLEAAADDGWQQSSSDRTSKSLYKLRYRKDEDSSSALAAIEKFPFQDLQSIFSKYLAGDDSWTKGAIWCSSSIDDDIKSDIDEAGKTGINNKNNSRAGKFTSTRIIVFGVSIFLVLGLLGYLGTSKFGVGHVKSQVKEILEDTLPNSEQRKYFDVNVTDIFLSESTQGAYQYTGTVNFSYNLNKLGRKEARIAPQDMKHPLQYLFVFKSDSLEKQMLKGLVQTSVIEISVKVDSQSNKVQVWMEDFTP